jgi:hypothetical protein
MRLLLDGASMPRGEPEFGTLPAGRSRADRRFIRSSPETDPQGLPKATGSRTLLAHHNDDPLPLALMENRHVGEEER